MFFSHRLAALATCSVLIWSCAQAENTADTNVHPTHDSGIAADSDVDSGTDANQEPSDQSSDADTTGDAQNETQSGDGSPGDGAENDVSASDVSANDVSSTDVASTDVHAEPAPNPCQGVTCSTPPSNTCADSNNLTVYDTNGTCDQGVCSYSSHPQACTYGCSNNACSGDPCVGVTCNHPGTSTCNDSSNLKVYDSPGNCAGGTCNYTSHLAYCSFGCANNACNGDPCAGVTCNSPTANYCTDATHLQVYSSPGTCSQGACTYSSTSQYCTFGCSLGACNNDPCAGVTCNSPTANYCTDANTLRQFTGAGSCSGGSCTYAYNPVNCPYGCNNGVCENCKIATDCAATGEYCDQGTCKTCNVAQHCGSACTDCTGLNPVQICNSAGTACIQCSTSAPCASGNWCDSTNLCELCNTASHCGASCVTCSGTTPTCNGTACACNSTSCGTGSMCSGTTCTTCNTTSNCGPACVACTSPTPSCGGATVGCQCTTGPDTCGGTTTWCNSGTCTACGSGSCGNGRCDCGETPSTCAADCGPACPTPITIGAWTSGLSGWSPQNNFWYYNGGYVAGGSETSYSSSYSSTLAYSSNVNLAGCASATISYDVALYDDITWSPRSDKSERLYIECSGDGGGTWTTLTPNPWPSNQSGCSTSYCNGGSSNDRSFSSTAQSIVLPTACRTATSTFRFRATGSSAWRMQNPGWTVATFKIN